MKYYFEEVDSEVCYTKSHIIDIMKLEGLTKKEVYVAQPSEEKDYFYCKAIGEVGEKGECGKQCSDYEPRNGKSGCCKHLGKLYTPTEKITISLT